MIFRETHLFFPTVPHKDIKQTVACVDFLCGAFHSGDPPQSSKRDLSPQLHPEGTQRRRGLGSWQAPMQQREPGWPQSPGPLSALTLVPRCRLSASRRRERAGTGAAGTRRCRPRAPPADGSSRCSKASFRSENGAMLPITIKSLKLESFSVKNKNF